MSGCVRKNGNRFWKFMRSFVMLSPIHGKSYENYLRKSVLAPNFFR